MVANDQIRLFPVGDFMTRSNEVETVYRRVNPDDWDGDGIANERDANPTICDGDLCVVRKIGAEFKSVLRA